MYQKCIRMYQNVAGFSSTLTHVSVSVSLSLDSSALSQAGTPPVHTPCPTWQTARRPHCLLHWARQGPQRLKPHQMACLLGGWMVCCLLTAQRGGMWMESSCSACCEKTLAPAVGGCPPHPLPAVGGCPPLPSLP